VLTRGSDLGWGNVDPDGFGTNGRQGRTVDLRLDNGFRLLISGGDVEITGRVYGDPLAKYALCQRCTNEKYSCTRTQAAAQCNTIGMRLCTLDEINAVAQLGGQSCCWGWTSTVDQTTVATTSTYRESQNSDGSFNGFAAYPYNVDESTAPVGCGGTANQDPNTGGVRVKRVATDVLQGAHCCAA